MSAHNDAILNDKRGNRSHGESAVASAQFGQERATLTVFLCHASRDKGQVRRIATRLRDAGFEPWLDIEKLLPGVRWRDAIDEALKKADAVIVFLSETSVQKDGFVQAEVRRALDIAKEKHDDSIFIIPAQLEDCLIPPSLADWQSVDLTSRDGERMLIAALKERAQQLDRNIVIAKPPPRSRLISTRNHPWSSRSWVRREASAKGRSSHSRLS